jgi:hypothetical protein
MPLPTLFNRSRALEPDESEPGPRPPEGYPFPVWQSEGDYAVPDTLEDDDETLSGLRELYASGSCDPRPEQVAGYHAGGSWYFPVSADGKHPGEEMTSRQLHGEPDFGLWLHKHRISEAVRQAKGKLAHDRRTAAFEASRRPCRACGTVVAPTDKHSKWVVGFGNVTGCTHCVETLAFLVGAEVVAHHDALEVLQAHAAELVAAKMGPSELDAGDEPA